MPPRRNKLSIETAGIEDLVMLDGTPDDSALDSVLLPAPRVPQKKPRATPPRPQVKVEPPAGGGRRRAVDLDLAADLNFSPPRDDAPTPSSPGEEDDLADVPEAASLPTPDAGDNLDGVPEAAPLRAGDLPLVPDVGPLCGPSLLPRSRPVEEDLKLVMAGSAAGEASQAPADIAAGMGFAAVDAVDKPEGGDTGEQEMSAWAAWAAMASKPLPQAWILVFGIICGIVAVVGMICTKW